MPDGTYTGHVDRSSQTPNGWIFRVEGGPLPAGTVIDIPTSDADASETEALNTSANQRDNGNTVELSGGNINRASSGNPPRT